MVSDSHHLSWVIYQCLCTFISKESTKQHSYFGFSQKPPTKLLNFTDTNTEFPSFVLTWKDRRQRGFVIQVVKFLWLKCFLLNFRNRLKEMLNWASLLGDLSTVQPFLSLIREQPSSSHFRKVRPVSPVQIKGLCNSDAAQIQVVMGYSPSSAFPCCNLLLYWFNTTFFSLASNIFCFNTTNSQHLCPLQWHFKHSVSCNNTSFVALLTSIAHLCIST